GYSRSASQGPCRAGGVHPWFVATVTNESANGLTPACSVTALDHRLRRIFRSPLEFVPGGLLAQIPAQGFVRFEWYLPVHGQIATMFGVCHEQRPVEGT